MFAGRGTWTCTLRRSTPTPCSPSGSRSVRRCPPAPAPAPAAGPRASAIAEKLATETMAGSARARGRAAPEPRRRAPTRWRASRTRRSFLLTAPTATSRSPTGTAPRPPRPRSGQRWPAAVQGGQRFDSGQTVPPPAGQVHGGGHDRALSSALRLLDARAARPRGCDRAPRLGDSLCPAKLRGPHPQGPPPPPACARNAMQAV